MKAIFGFLCVAFFYALHLPSYGRIGETLAQCVERYGEVTNVTEPISGASPEDIIREHRVYRFQKADYILLVWFFNDKAARITFTKRTLAGFSEDETNLLLQANSAGVKWKTKDSQRWESEDGALKARGAGSNILTFFTKEFEHVLEETAKERARERLEGF